MNLLVGSAGTEVQQVQESLNRLPTSLPFLSPDGKFGLKTKNRVKEFQLNNHLKDDGIVGQLTRNAIAFAISLLGLIPPEPIPVTGPVRPVTQEILGLAGTDNLILQTIPSIAVINESTFRPGDLKNIFDFKSVPLNVCRMGIFAAKKNNLERALILILPKTGIPKRVLIGISHGFAGNELAFYESMGWGDPLSKKLINSILNNHVINGHSWAGQMLSSKKQMAYLHIVRARGIELGPFANDGQFVLQTLKELISLTNNAFSFDDGIEIFTYSSGIGDTNVFTSAVSAQLSVRAVYAIDPAPAINAFRPPGAFVKQFLSGQTSRGEYRPGFEFLGAFNGGNRWSKEWNFVNFSRRLWTPLQYFHGYAMPGYVLNLSLQL